MSLVSVRIKEVRLCYVEVRNVEILARMSQLGNVTFQMFFKKLMDILALDLPSVHYEKRELILDAINQVTVKI